MITTLTGADASTSGIYANASTSGNRANASTSGNEAHASTSGNEAHASTSGDRANASTSGIYANASTSGNRANASTSGIYAHASTSGNEAHASTSGNRANASTSGEHAHATTSGEHAHATTSGEHAHATTSGEHAHATTSGEHARAMAAHGAASSTHGIAVGVMVKLSSTSMPAVILPQGTRHRSPVLVAPATHPVDVWLELGDEGEVIERPDILLLDDGRGYMLTYAGGAYDAGCRSFAYDAAVAHWSNPDHLAPDAAARLLAAVQRHHQDQLA